MLLGEVDMHVFDVSGWESILNTTVTCCDSNSVVSEKGRSATPMNNVNVNVCMSCRKPIKDDGAAEDIDTAVGTSCRKPIKDDGTAEGSDTDVCMNFRAPMTDAEDAIMWLTMMFA